MLIISNLSNTAHGVAAYFSIKTGKMAKYLILLFKTSDF